jgi:hypothetical protein
MGGDVSEATTRTVSEPATVRARAHGPATPAAEIADSARLPPRLDRGTAIALQRHAGNRAASRLAASAPGARSAIAERLLARDVTVTATLPDGITCKSCSSDQAAQIGAAHQRGKLLARNAIAKLITYHGGPGEIHDALMRNFHDASEATARDVAQALAGVIALVPGTGYVCKAEANGSTEAMALWCVPYTDIRVYPLFYSNTSVNYRGSTLLHEWMHRYHCDLDLGYSWESDYTSNSHRRQSWNADAYSTLAYEIGQPTVGDFEPPSSDTGAA